MSCVLFAYAVFFFYYKNIEKETPTGQSTPSIHASPQWLAYIWPLWRLPQRFKTTDPSLLTLESGHM